MRPHEPGQQFGEYRLDAVISDSGAVTLYRAHQDTLDRDVALYIGPSSNSEQGRQFTRQAVAIARLEDPRILPIYDVGALGGVAYAAGALPASRSLAELGGGDRRISPEQAVRLGKQLAVALEELERAGLTVSRLPAAAVMVSDGDAYLAPLQADLVASDDGVDTASALAVLLETSLHGGAGDRQLPPALVEALNGSYSSPSALMQAITSVLPKAHRRVPRAAFGVAAVVLAAVMLTAVVAAVVLVGGQQSSTRRPAPADLPVGRVVARVPLGATPRGALAAGGWIWVGTREGKLLRVDPRTRQLVGAPIKLDPEIGGLAASGNNLYVASLTRVTRVNAITGRVDAHTQMRPQPLALAVAGRSLWVTRASMTKGHFASYDLIRLDDQTLKPVARPIPLKDGVGSGIAVRGHTAWVTDLLLGTMTRVDTRDGTQRSIQAGSQPHSPVYVGNQLWFADGELQTVTALDATNMRLPDRVVRLVGRPANLTVAPGTIWATSTDAQVGAGRLYRIDPAARQVLGRPLELGSGMSTALSSVALANGALWIPAFGQHALLEVLPRSPLPGPGAAAASPGVLSPGPVHAGRWIARDFVAPFAFLLPDSGWLFAGDTISQRRIVTLEVVNEPGTSISVEAPTVVFGAGGRGTPVRSPIQVIHTLETNENLRLSSVSHTTIAGTTALAFTARVRPSLRLADFCLLEPCAAVWGAGPATSTLVASESDRIAVMRRNGQTLVIDVSARLHGSQQRRLEAVLRSLRFLGHE